MIEDLNAYQTLVQLVDEASSCSDAVDLFDLRGDQMQEAWSFLLRENHKAFITLVRHVQANAEAIIAIMGDAPAAPDEPPPALLQSQALANWRFAAMCHYAIAAEQAAINGVETAPPASLTSLRPLLGSWRRGVFLERLAQNQAQWDAT